MTELTQEQIDALGSELEKHPLGRKRRVYHCADCDKYGSLIGDMDSCYAKGHRVSFT